VDKYQNVNIKEQNVNIKEQNVNIKEQRKGKNKERESKEEREEAQAPINPPDEKKEKFIFFQNWIEKNAPNVSKLKEPFTQNQYEKLQIDFPGQNEVIRDTLLSMHNKPDLTKKYISANLTLRNWIKLRNHNATPAAVQPAAISSDIYKAREKHG
jgi:hypothetical protein